MKLEANKEFMEISPYKYTCVAHKAFKALYKNLQISGLHQVVKKRSSVRLRLTVILASCYSTTFDAAFSG